MSILNLIEKRLLKEMHKNLEGEIYLDYDNYVYYQRGKKNEAQSDIDTVIVKYYEEWEGGEEFQRNISDEDYNRFTWLVDEGEEVYEHQHIATIKNKHTKYANEYWVILVANSNGIIHKEIKNGEYSIDSDEFAATIYETMERYAEAVIATGKVKEKDSRVRKCPDCGSLLDSKKKFCGECGRKLIFEEKNCVNCGEKIMQGQKYCFECGEKVE